MNAATETNAAAALRAVDDDQSDMNAFRRTSNLAKGWSRQSGLLRVSLPVDFATNYLAPRMPDFASGHSGIKCEFDLTPCRVDLVSEQSDVAVQMGGQLDSRSIARKPAQLPWYL